jgi:DNA-binding transcriptional regulator YdaS (Cro superfamily)
MTKILAWRKSTGLTQADLARRLGIKARSHISALESGHERVSAEQAIAIDRLSRGQVTVAELRPDLHDVFVRHPEAP